MMLKFENLAKEFTDTNSSAVTSFIVNILRATFYWLRAFRRTPFLVSSCFHLHNHSTDFTCFGKSWQNKFQFIVLEGRGYGQENFSELSTQITYIYIYIYIYVRILCSNSLRPSVLQIRWYWWVDINPCIAFAERFPKQI